MDNPRVIGHIAAVQGFRVKVELLPETKSALRATLEGVQIAVAINAYLTFSIGAGQVVIGIITDLESRESYDPASGDDLTLELVKPRRTASVQLLGTVERDGERGTFSPGITILPTLDTPAEISAPDILKAVFELPPQRNRPEGYEGKDFDYNLRIGSPTGQPANAVRASYNDLFSRPLAIVGNTGSGKSYTVSSLVQKAMEVLAGSAQEPHVFILDINGEYANAFPSKAKATARLPDRVYLNGTEFGIPLWFFNAEEVCAWLSASEQTQEPVLKDWWSIAKASSDSHAKQAPNNSLRHAITKANVILQTLDATNKPFRKICCQQFRILEQYIGGVSVDGMAALRAALQPHMSQLTANNPDWSSPNNEPEIRAATEVVIESLRAHMGGNALGSALFATTADSPLFVPKSHLRDPLLLDAATPAEEVGRIEAHLTTLKLRLNARLDDRRWRSFLNYEDVEIAICDLGEWLDRFGVGGATGPKVSVIDLSMLSNEVLPYACAVVGRILLEVRESLAAQRRFKHPWVLVLEEAHNYARPGRTDEDRGHRLARLAYERIAKEGRKFGLSLIVASQRPSEISPTIISQCANFISHRLQNPDDIDHFRRIIPLQARRLLDQVTTLASGEAIVFGSAFHVPTRVLFDRPNPGPHSQTAAPYYEWKTETDPFPLAEVIGAWGLAVTKENGAAATPVTSAAGRTSSDFDDDIPF
jgi:DNA helicase HerA-like ATPase